MSNEIIKYHNDINLIDLNFFSQRELDFLISCFWYLKENEKLRAEISFYDLKEKLKIERIGNTREIAISFAKKIKRIVETYEFIDENNHKITLIGNIFNTVKIDETEEVLILQIDEDFEYLFNKLVNNYTKFELEEFVRINGKYSKILYKFLKQYKLTGYFKISIEQFRELFGVPSSYKNSHISERIINPSIEELKDIFYNLNCKKIRKKRKITHLEFIFLPQTKNGDYDIYK